MSIVIPTYNRRKFLEEAVESIKNQTYNNIETIFIDGGSDDGTTEFLNSLSNMNMTTIARERPKGQSNARNKGIEKADGDYILFLDDDDKLQENAVEKMAEVLKNLSEEYAGVHTGEKTFGEIEDIRCICPGKSEKVSDLSFGTSCTMFKSDIFDEVKGFNEDLVASEDLEFIIRLFSEGYSLYGIDDFMYKRRVHEGQLTKNYEDVISANYSIIEMHKEKLSTKELFERYHKISKLLIQIGKKRKAIQNIKESKKLLDDKKSKLNPVEILDRYEKLSRLYIEIRDNEKAFSTIMDSERLFEKNISNLGEEKREHFFREISNLYRALEDDELRKKGLESILELLTQCEEKFDERYLLYRRLGIKFAETGNSKKARDCFKCSIKRNIFDRFSYYYYFWLLFGEEGYRKGIEIEDLLKENMGATGFEPATYR